METSYNKKGPLKQKMATWMMHLRIADYFRTRLEVAEIPFIVGNIGPDCGEILGEWGDYDPPSTITHWRTNGSKDEINAEAFFDTYLSHREGLSKNQVSFYLGYYIHLLTDIEFYKKVYARSMEQYEDRLREDPKFKHVIVQDWYDLDYLYLRDNPSFPAFKCIESIDSFPNDYLDYYSDTAILKRIKYLTQFYQKGGENLDRPYTYLTQQALDLFIKETCHLIEDLLKQKQQ